MWTAASGKPGEAALEFVGTAIARLGHMKAPHIAIVRDLIDFSLGSRNVYDYRGFPVLNMTDTVWEKAQKMMIRWWQELEPISVSSRRNMVRKNIDPTMTWIASLIGLRATVSERDKKVGKLIRMTGDLSKKRGTLYGRLLHEDADIEDIKAYNVLAEKILTSDYMTPKLRQELEERHGVYTIDVDLYLGAKLYALGARGADPEKIEQYGAMLRHLGIDEQRAISLLAKYRRHLRRTGKGRGPSTSYPKRQRLVRGRMRQPAGKE